MPRPPSNRRRAGYDHVWYWRSRLRERKDSPCRVVAYSLRLGSVLVEFEDGFRVVTSRHAVRRAEPPLLSNRPRSID